MQDAVVYKILLPAELASLLGTGRFDGSPSDLADGFVHLSSATQVARTVERHFSGIDSLQIAAVDAAALGEAIKWEPSSGGQLFPHLYAPLSLNDVIAHGPLTREADGSIRLPSP